MPTRGDLRPALDQLGGCADDEAREAAGGARDKYLGEVGWRRGRVGEQREGAVVGYEE